MNRSALAACLISLPLFVNAQTVGMPGGAASTGPQVDQTTATTPLRVTPSTTRTIPSTANPSGVTAPMPAESNAATSDHRSRKPSGTSLRMAPESNSATSDHSGNTDKRNTAKPAE